MLSRSATKRTPQASKEEQLSKSVTFTHNSSTANF